MQLQNSFFVDQTNYITQDQYTHFNYLYEYDISKANISCLRACCLVSNETYMMMAGMEKRDREVVVGQWIRQEKEANGKSVAEIAIKEGIMMAKRWLVVKYGIADEAIVRIANDSILVKSPREFNGLVATYQDWKYPIEFHCAGKYTSMIKIAKIIILYNSESGEADIKGIQDSNLVLHKDFLTAICTIMMYYEMGDKKVALMKYHEFYEDYINLRLSPSYYRELNAASGYRLKSSGNNSVPINHGVTWWPDYSDTQKIDISYNLFILREIYGILIK